MHRRSRTTNTGNTYAPVSGARAHKTKGCKLFHKTFYYQPNLTLSRKFSLVPRSSSSALRIRFIKGFVKSYEETFGPSCCQNNEKCENCNDSVKIVPKKLGVSNQIERTVCISGLLSSHHLNSLQNCVRYEVKAGGASRSSWTLDSFR